MGKIKTNLSRYAVLAVLASVFMLLGITFSGMSANVTQATTGEELGYFITNLTKDKVIRIDERNNARYSNMVVMYDEFFGATTGTNEWGQEIVVNKENGKYVVAAITAANTAGNSVIPVGGFVISASAIDKVSGFEVGDELEIVDRAPFVLKNLTEKKELYITDRNTDSADNATVWLSGATVSSQAWRNRIVAEWDEAEDAYVVIAITLSSQDATSPEVPAKGLIIDAHGAKYNDANNFIHKTKIGDKLEFEDKNPPAVMTPVNFSITKGELTLTAEGLNPIDASNITGAVVLYSSTWDKTHTWARSGETVAEYVIKPSVGGQYIIEDKFNAGGNYVLPGAYVLSVSSSTEGYNDFIKGDIVECDDTNESPINRTLFVDNLTQNLRIPALGTNMDRGGDMLVIYNDRTFLAAPQAGLENKIGHTGTNQWGVEIIVVYDEIQSKYIVTTVTQSGTGGNAEIPENGFVLSGHGTGAAALSPFKVGDEVGYYDYVGLTNVNLRSITVNGEKLPDFQPDRKVYSITVDKSVTTAPVVEAEAFKNGAIVAVTPIEEATGSVLITVTAIDGQTTGTYTINFRKDWKTNSLLSSINVGGKALNGFDSNVKEYSVYIEKGNPFPEVSALSVDSDASVSIIQANDNNLEAVITVKAEDPDYSRVYKVKFILCDTSLKEIIIDGKVMEDFDKDTVDYSYTLAAGTENIVIKAIASDDDAKVTITNSNNKSIITVTSSQGGMTRVYTINFESAKDNGGNIALGAVLGSVAGVLVLGGAAVIVIKKKSV